VQSLAASFAKEGIQAAPVWGAMTQDQRRGALRRFRDGEIAVLTNCNVPSRITSGAGE